MAPSQWSFTLFSCGWWSSGHTCSGGHCRHLLPQVPQQEKGEPNFWHLNPRLKSYKSNMHLKNTLLQKSIQVYLYHLVESHFTSPVEIMFVGRFQKTRFGPRFFMVGFLGRLLPWDSAGETFSGGFASFLLKGHPIPFKFPGCISKVYSSTYTYIAYMMYLYIHIYIYIHNAYA